MTAPTVIKNLILFILVPFDPVDSKLPEGKLRLANEYKHFI
jgi:hypothetical protein